MNATICDVSRLSGVSIATVSHTFANPDRVRGSTRQKVFEAAEIPLRTEKAHDLLSASGAGDAAGGLHDSAVCHVQQTGRAEYRAPRGPANNTVPLALLDTEDNLTNFGLAAGDVISVVPITLFVIFAQNYLISELSSGAVKE